MLDTSQLWPTNGTMVGSLHHCTVPFCLMRWPAEQATDTLMAVASIRDDFLAMDAHLWLFWTYLAGWTCVLCSIAAAPRTITTPRAGAAIADAFRGVSTSLYACRLCLADWTNHALSRSHRPSGSRVVAVKSKQLS